MAPGGRGLSLLLLPLLLLPQVGRAACWVLAVRGGSVLGPRRARAHACPHRWRSASLTAAATPRTSARPRPVGAACGTWGSPCSLSSCCCSAGSRQAVSGSAASGSGPVSSLTRRPRGSAAT